MKRTPLIRLAGVLAWSVSGTAQEPVLYWSFDDDPPAEWEYRKERLN